VKQFFKHRQIRDVVKTLSSDILRIVPESSERKNLGYAVLDVFIDLCCDTDGYSVADLAETFTAIECCKPEVSDFLSNLADAHIRANLKVRPDVAHTAAEFLSQNWNRGTFDIVWHLVGITEDIDTVVDEIKDPFWVGLCLNQIVNKVVSQGGDLRENLAPYAEVIAILYQRAPAEFVGNFLEALLDLQLDDDKITDRQWEQLRAFIGNPLMVSCFRIVMDLVSQAVPE
jgi:hypothetical protein